MPLPLFKLQLRDHNCKLDEYEAILGHLSYLQRVKHYWLKFTLISEYTYSARELFRSSAARHAERERQIMSGNTFIIHPLSNFRVMWQMIMIVVLGGSLILIPHIFTMNLFGVDETNYYDIFVTDLYVLSSFYFILLADIVVNFLTGYRVKGTSEIVLEPRLIAGRYLRTFFLIDLISSLPLDLAILTWFSEEVWGKYEYYYPTYEGGILTTMAFIKLFRLPTLFHHIHHVCKAFRIHVFVARSITVFVFFLQLLVWIACLTYLVPQMIYGPQLMNRSSPDWGKSWLHTYKIFNETTSTRLMQSITRTLPILQCMGGCTTNNFDFIENLMDRPIVVLIGRIFYAFLFATIIYMTLSYFDSETKYCNMMDELEAFMYHTLVPTKIRERMRTYYKYCYQKKFYRAHSIQKTMPVLLRCEMDMIACRRLINSVALFKDLPRNVVNNIVSSLTQEIFLEDDVIIKHGTLGNCMYFIASGSVAVSVPVTEDDRCYYKEICHLVDGDHFGEVALMELVQPRNGTVVTLETTTCYRLEGEDFYTIIDSNKELFNRVSEISQERNSFASHLSALP